MTKHRGEMFKGAPPSIHECARSLRKNLTKAESELWQYLRKKPGGFKVRWQHPIPAYVADFYCHAGRLVIEVDGPVHLTREVIVKDEYKEADIQRMGLYLLRFINEQVLNATEKVVDEILIYLKQITNPDS